MKPNRIEILFRQTLDGTVYILETVVKASNMAIYNNLQDSAFLIFHKVSSIISEFIKTNRQGTYRNYDRTYNDGKCTITERVYFIAENPTIDYKLHTKTLQYFAKERTCAHCRFFMCDMSNMWCAYNADNPQILQIRRAFCRIFEESS